MDLDFMDLDLQKQKELNELNRAIKKAFQDGYDRGWADAHAKFKDADLKKEMENRESPEEEAERIRIETHNENQYDASKERICPHCGDKMELSVIHPSPGQGLPTEMESYICHKPNCQLEEYLLLCKQQGIELSGEDIAEKRDLVKNEKIC